MGSLDMEKKMKINAEKFAYAVISSQSYENMLSEDIAKQQLTLYLSAYWLAEKFNDLESQSFKNMEKHEYERLMEKISRMRVFS